MRYCIRSLKYLLVFKAKDFIYERELPLFGLLDATCVVVGVIPSIPLIYQKHNG